ncbi:MAG TPA: CaiB/BaiF CoA-transferase family protein [Acidimicrobiales bacterium]|nr:CaiB/BaiF CoA-transferase family protein [Acidimicrobiales bacterium]
MDENGAELRLRVRPHPAPRGAVDAPVGEPPLAGVTVVELGTFYAGPFGSTVLADLGARVIKFEPLEGDPMRTIVPFPETGAVKVLSGKESVAVDIGSTEGHEIVSEAVRRADIVLRSFRAGVAERLRYDDKTLLAINPNLVYLNAPGFGVDGPYGHRPAYAPTIGAGAGQAGRNLGPTMIQSPDLSMDQVKDLSLRMGGAVMSGSNPDANAALAVATGMLLGLLARKRGAPGQSMLTTMLNTMSHVLSEEMVEYEGRGPAPTVDPKIHGFGPLYRIYPAADATWLFLAAPAEREWTELARALRPYADLHADARFATTEARSHHGPELAETLEAVFVRKPAADWEVELTPNDVACVVVEKGPSEACIMEGDNALARIEGQAVELEHPVLGQYIRLKSLVGFSRSEGRAHGAPLLGQDTQAVLAELGYDDEAIADLCARGIIRS